MVYKTAKKLGNGGSLHPISCTPLIEFSFSFLPVTYICEIRWKSSWLNLNRKGLFFFMFYHCFLEIAFLNNICNSKETGKVLIFCSFIFWEIAQKCSNRHFCKDSTRTNYFTPYKSTYHQHQKISLLR